MPRKYMKRRRMRRSPRRYIKRYKRYPRGTKTEIKFYTDVIESQALKIANNTATSDALYAEQNYLSNILSNIAQGVGFGDRIGSKIYVMKIAVRMLVYGCPSSGDYVIGSFVNRHIWHNSPNPAGSAVLNFFLTQSAINFYQYPDRKVFTIHKDRSFNIPATEYATSTDDPARNMGPVKQITYNIPVNRYVTYTLNSKVKEDYNVYSLAILTAIAPMIPNTRQVGCFGLTYRIYFKDT